MALAQSERSVCCVFDPLNQFALYFANLFCCVAQLVSVWSEGAQAGFRSLGGVTGRRAASTVAALR
mgnify:CR=1 FL=1